MSSLPGWVQVLDIIHVRDKLRLAAHLHYKKESSAAKEYVKERLVAVLTGEAGALLGAGFHDERAVIST